MTTPKNAAVGSKVHNWPDFGSAVDKEQEAWRPKIEMNPCLRSLQASEIEAFLAIIAFTNVAPECLAADAGVRRSPKVGVTLGRWLCWTPKMSISSVIVRLFEMWPALQEPSEVFE